MSAVIGKALGVLATNYRQELSVDQLQVYITVLKPYGDAAVSQACMDILRDPDAPGWFPRTQEIIMRITGSRKAAAALAWHKFRNNLSQLAAKTVAFDDPLIHHCVQLMGGWKRLGDNAITTNDKLRDDFIAFYTDAMACLPDPATIPTRLVSDDNAPEGKAILVGDKDTARLVLTGQSARAMLTLKRQPAAAAIRVTHVDPALT